MRDLLTLLENLAMAEAAKKDPNAPSTLFANGLTPTQIMKKDWRWDLLINKISTSSWDSYLKCFIANIEGLNLSSFVSIKVITSCCRSSRFVSSV